MTFIRALIFVVVAMVTAQATSASETVLLHAAGSLRAALTEIVGAYEQASGVKVEAKYGASGLLRDEIANGARAEVFASANMEHPQALASSGKSGPVALFARNRLCALVRPGVATEPDTLLDRMLDNDIKLATSTPKADPSGDYAWEVFHKADRVRPGSLMILERKALQLTGGPSSPQFGNRNVYGALVAEGQADIFLTYCTNAKAAAQENPGQRVVELPETLYVGADYGLTMMSDASPAARRFAAFILSEDARHILAKYGFAVPTSSQSK